MSEFELLQLVAAWSEVTNLTETILFTLVFAYLAAAHFVGANLSRLQLYIVTIIYSAAILRTVAAHFAQSSRLVQLGDELVEMGSTYTVQIPSFGPHLAAGIWIVGFGMSLLYMHTCRRPERS